MVNKVSPLTELYIGRPRFRDSDLAYVAARDGIAAAWRAGFERFGTGIASHVEGDFAVALHDASGRTFMAVDRFSIRTLCYRLSGDDLSFAERCDELADASAVPDPQAIFHYLYHHVIPAPRTIFADIFRLPAGHYAILDAGKLTVAPWWVPVFEERRRESLRGLRAEFRRLLREAVGRQIDGATIGCFLSGGTDSSTVAGILGEVTRLPAKTFSIGFDADGYDEMEYARITARHFGTDHHEHYITPDELVRSIPTIATAYDQPFGNSSALPAYYCAKMAKEAGVDRILAGDGGDELFGGNSRYAKQRLLAVYDVIPKWLRKAVLEPILLSGALLTTAPGIKKVVSYVDQARVPMPDRLQMYNMLTRIGAGEILTAEFLRRVDAEAPLRDQRAVYASCNAASLVNRMLTYDWKYALADSDLPKVVVASSLAGLEVGFPLLDDQLVDFSLRLEPYLKLKGVRLRWFFKEALRGFLPEPTLAKKKHGFGLPFGFWMMKHARLRTVALDSLELLRESKIVRSAFLDRLTSEYLPRHPGYYGEMVWVLMMLAQWGERSKRLLRY